MTIVVPGTDSYLLSAQAVLLPEDRETASLATWASSHVVPNRMLRWIVGNYVQADAANSNGHLWSLDDLQMSRPTIQHAPLNMLHKEHYIVGHYVANEMNFPTQERAADGITTPYIETLAAMYRFYFPDETMAVERAFAEGALWQSMECIAESLTCKVEDCGKTFPYQGVRSSAYCDHMNAGAVRQFNKPHFLAGGLILGNVRPGWSNADIKDIAQFMAKNGTLTERIYDRLSQEAPHLDPVEWEHAMGALILQAQGSKKSPELLAKLVTVAI